MARVRWKGDETRRVVEGSRREKKVGWREARERAWASPLGVRIGSRTVWSPETLWIASPWRMRKTVGECWR